MKKNYFIKLLFSFLFVCSTINISAQEDTRIQQLKTKLESIIIDAPGLNQKAEINVNNVALSDFLQALANTHNINLNIHPELNEITIKNNFSNATVIDVLIFVCKEYHLEIDFTGNILSIHKIIEKKPEFKQRTVPISYDSNSDFFSIDLQQDSLYVVFKQIMDATNKNLVFSQGLANLKLSGYIKNMPFDSALDKIAFSNNLSVTKTRDNYYLFEQLDDFAYDTNSNNAKDPKNKKQQQRPKKQRRSNFFFEINENKTLNVDFTNTPIANIIYDIGNDLNKDMFMASPLEQAGNATVKATNVSYDLLLNKILENTEFTYKKSDSIYYFGKKEQVSLRDAVVVPLMHRSIEIMTSSGGLGRQAGRNNFNNSSQNSYGNNSYGNSNSSNYSNNSNNFNNSNTNRQGGVNGTTNNRQSVNTNRSRNFSSNSNQLESLISMLPDDALKDLNVSVDIELNSFIVSGPSQNIERFKEFITYIDKPVPVILIEVMLLEINKSATIETGVSWGIGSEPSKTQGNIYPDADINLGAKTINRIIGSFNSFSTFNLGKVVPDFFARIKALETNGDIKIRSSPRLSALNGHRASLSIGETTYYAVTRRDIIGSQNPQTSTITNFYPVDAEFAINIRPIVSGDGQITLDIKVIQSSFNGKKVAEDAPPGVNSREFNSIIRVKDQDLVILGGLEEKIKNDTGTGVPFLARIPIIKWLFSKKKREDTKKKLTVLIKPTIIK